MCQFANEISPHVAESITDKLNELSGIMQITACAGPTEGEVTAECQHMIYPVVQICLELLPDSITCIADAREVGDGCYIARLPYCVQDLKVFPDISAASTICA